MTKRKILDWYCSQCVGKKHEKCINMTVNEPPCLKYQELSSMLDELIDGAPSEKTVDYTGDDFDAGYNLHCDRVDEWKAKAKEGEG